MTKEQVKSFKQFGPYKSFSNGDLETYNGIFRGRKENVQFFFKNDRLVSIGVYLWEGKGAKQGIPVWQRVYEILQKDYGKVAEPDLISSSGPTDSLVTGIGGAVNTYATANTRLMPARQPRDMRVLAQFMGATITVRGKSVMVARTAMGNTFAIAIFFDPK